MSTYGGSFAGSRDDFSARSIKNSQLPTLIKCSACKRSREHIHFSNRQISNLKFRATKGGARNKYDFGPKPGKVNDDGLGGVRCRECTGEPTSELLCIGCGAIKDLSQFAKVQRKNPDEAKCLECMEEVARVGEDDNDGAVGVDYEDISDDDYDDYIHEDSRSIATGITNPWATYEDGDYVTASDVASGRWPSEYGSDTHSIQSVVPASARHGNRSANENARSVQYGGRKPGNGPTQDRSSMRDASQTSRATSSVATQPRRTPVATRSPEPADALGSDEWQTAGPRKPRDQAGSTGGNDGQRPSVWGPGGQAAAHLRAASSQMNDPNARGVDAGAGFSSPRTIRKSEDARDRKFPKTRPEKNSQPNPRSFAKIRPDNRFRGQEDDDDGEYYDLSKASGPAASGSKYADANNMW